MFGAPGLENADLGDFLARPVRIARSENFGPLADRSAVPFTNGVLDPWREYLNVVSVENKLKNFNLFRGTLNLRVVVNGTRFNFGRAMLCYEPLRLNKDDTHPTTSRLDPCTITQTGIPDGSMLLGSQLPHIMIDPSQNQTSEMQIPFVYPTEWLQIATSSGDYNVGGLRFVIIRDLDAVGDGVSGVVTTTIYAWFSDVQLSGLTTLQAQSGEEYETEGAISGPATSVALAASMLSAAPIIGPFARATEIGASAIASIAKIFGYSKPVLLSDPNFVKNMPYSHFANTSATVATQKLTYDAKAELTVDGGAVGLAQNDDMTIHNIAGHPSILTFFDWSTADSLATSWSLPIDPGLYNNVTVTPSAPALATAANAYTALSFASRPFELWTGTLVYRVQIICSDFHKGRLRIGYDPNPTATPTINNTSLIYSRIVDISNEKEFTIEVPWTQGPRWKHINHTAIQDILRADTTNGVLQFQVINGLVTTGSTDSTIRIVVWVYAGQDFQLARPTTKYIKAVQTGLEEGPPSVNSVRSKQRMRSSSVLPNVAESGEEVDSPVPAQLEAKQQSNAPTCCDTTDVQPLAQTSGEAQHLNLVYMGERYVSFRTLLKRMTYYRTFTFTGGYSENFDWFNIWLPHFPLQHGYADDVLNPIDKFNDGSTCLMAYLIPAFATVRGSTRISLMIKTNRGSDNKAVVYRTSIGDTPAGNRLDLITDPTTTDYREMFDLQGNGGMIYDLDIQSGMELESPFYHQYRFGVASSGSCGNLTPSGVTGVDVVEVETQGLAMFVSVDGNGGSAGAALDVFYGAGEDFNLNWFLGCPFDLDYPIP